MAYDDRARIQDYRTVFGTEAGKRVLGDMASRHWYFRGTLHPEALVMAHREGERNAILEILRYLELKPDDLAAFRAQVREQFGEDE